MLLVDEMDADWSQVIAELAPAADVYKDPVTEIQMVGGSGTIAHSYMQYRELGARARAMLVAAAAEKWKAATQRMPNGSQRGSRAGRKIREVRGAGGCSGKAAGSSNGSAEGAIAVPADREKGEAA